MVPGSNVSSEAEDPPDSTPPARPLRSMQTGQNCIAPENSLPQLGQVRWGSVFMDLAVLPRRLKVRKEHRFPRRSPPDVAHCGRPPGATVRGAKRTCRVESNTAGAIRLKQAGSLAPDCAPLS